MWQVRGPDGAVAAGWYLLPLRLFLGVTFVFAGLQKLANPDFFRASSPISIHAQLVGASRTSPIGAHARASRRLGVGDRRAHRGGRGGDRCRCPARPPDPGGRRRRDARVPQPVPGHLLPLAGRTSPARTSSSSSPGRRWCWAGPAGRRPSTRGWPADGRPRPTGPPYPEAVPEGALTRGAVVGLIAAASAVLIGVVAGVGRALAPASTNAANTLHAAAADHHHRDADHRGRFRRHHHPDHRAAAPGNRRSGPPRRSRWADRPPSTTRQTGDPSTRHPADRRRLQGLRRHLSPRRLHRRLPGLGQDHRLPVPRLGVQPGQR